MNAFHRSTVAALAAAFSIAAGAAGVQEARVVPAFTGVGLAAPIEVDLTQGDRDSVVLEGDAESLARIETVVAEGFLRIRVREDAMRDTRPLRARARVTARNVERLSLAGSGDIASGPLRGDRLAVSIAGSGDVRIAGGQVRSLTAQIAGSGDLGAGRLEAGTVTVSIAGSGDATVWARDSLSAKVAGSGDVRYYGDATVARSVMGSGDVRRLAAAP